MPEPEIDPVFEDSMTIAAARPVLEHLAEDGGAKCPVCGQHAEVYVRKLDATIAIGVGCLWAEYLDGWGHLGAAVAKHAPSLAGRGGHLCLGQHWGLIDHHPNEDGGHRGFWRVTATGEAWLRGHRAIHSEAVIFRNELRETRGPKVLVADVLKARFDLDAVLAPAGSQATLFSEAA